MTHKHIQTKANTDKLCETLQNQRYSPIKKKQRNVGQNLILLSAICSWVNIFVDPGITLLSTNQIWRTRL